MVRHLYMRLLSLTLLYVTLLPTSSLQAQIVREIDLNCVPTFTPPSELLIPHPDEYYASYGADVSPDGKLLAVVAVNRVVFFDTETFEPVQQIILDPQYQDYWRALAWSPGGNYLAVYIGPRNGILIISAAATEIEQLLPTNDEYTSMTAYTLAWSPDSSRLAVLGQLPWRVWDVESGEILYEVVSENMYMLSPLIYGEQYMAAWSPDGSQLAIPEAENVLLLDTVSWSEVARLSANFWRIVSLEWSSTGRLFVTNGDWLLDAWNPASAERIEQVRLATISVVAQLSLDETRLAVAGGHDISILDPETLEIITTITTETLWGSINNLHWLDDERIIIYGDYSIVEIWNVTTGKMEHTWHINCLAPEDDGSGE